MSKLGNHGAPSESESSGTCHYRGTCFPSALSLPWKAPPHGGYNPTEPSFLRQEGSTTITSLECKVQAPTLGRAGTSCVLNSELPVPRTLPAKQQLFNKYFLQKSTHTQNMSKCIHDFHVHKVLRLKRSHLIIFLIV